jgi:hypothetical protein
LALALLFAAAFASCRRSPVQVTGLRVVAVWKDVEVDQLEFGLVDLEGNQLVAPQKRPTPPRALTSPSDVVIYLGDHLGGSEVRCNIRAFAGERMVGFAQTTRHIIARSVVEARVTLTAGAGSKVPGGTCMTGGECESGLCVDGVCCQTECSGVCRSCAVPGKQGTCVPVPEGVKHRDCADQGAETCGFDGTCDGLGACRRHPTGTRCAAGACEGSRVVAAGACNGEGACVMGPVQTCAPFNCDARDGTPRCFSTCTSSAQCVPGRECVGGSCGKKQAGASCMDGVECSSGFCADGVCCDSACDGPCSSCAQVGSVGVCRAVPNGVRDPRGICQDGGAASCRTTGVCDGNGGCARYAAGTICKPPACTGPSAQTTASRCDGQGTCVQGGPLDCAPFACSAATGSCNSTCTRNEDCVTTIVCTGRSCGKKGLGQPCESAAECNSNFCVDKVCCRDSCQGACRSCALSAMPGVCSLSLPGAPDPRGVCRDQGKSSCGTDGTCNGNGDCRRYAPGTVCAAGTCNAATNQRSLPSTCDSGGRCSPGAAVSCSPYRCNGAVCFSACGSDVDCVPPNTCIGGACGQRGIGASCSKATDCAAPFTCIGSVCQTKPLGDPCAAGNECTSGNCVEGVCCSSASCGRCQSCRVSGAVGYCQPRKAGATDPMCAATPAAACGLDGTCDGAGNCRFHPAGTQCAPASCNGRERNRPDTCDGAGTCKDGGTTDCGPFLCNPATSDCFQSCTSNNQCCCGNMCRGNNTCG